MTPNYFETNLLPFQIQFENGLKESIINKCKLLTDLITESLSSNLKEIQQRFLILIEDIFSFQSSVSYSRTDWKLRSITRETNLQEFNSIFEFMSTNGILLKLIRQLTNDPSIRYDFPISCLPAPTRAAFEDGLIPNFYNNKLSQNFSNSISLNAFEFYIFHFSYFITNPSKNCRSCLDFGTSDNSNVIYYALLENYLEAFIPFPTCSYIFSANNNKNSLNENQSLWKSLSLTTSNILNLGSPSNEFHFKNNKQNLFNTFKMSNDDRASLLSPKLPAISPSLHKTSIVNSKIFSIDKFQPNLNQSYDSNEYDALGTTLFKCETLLNIFTEFWLNHASAFNLDDTRNTANHPHLSFSFTVEHMRVVRILVKHLHYFANSNQKKNCDFNSSQLHTQYNSGGIVTSEVTDPLDDLRRNLWSSKYPIQKKLYQFLRLAFDRWPNDSSFRVPLETWLSYIQPWRYIQRSTANKQNEDPNESQGISSEISEWKRFISENLFFYTIIFRQVINRISKILDINSTSSAFLLYRMTKVFAQNNLCDLIKEIELNFSNGPDLAFNFRLNSNNLSQHQHILSHSIKQISGNNVVTPIKHALMDMEPLHSEYVSLFTPLFRDQIISLLLKIAKYLHFSEAKQKNIPSTSSASNAFSSILNFLSGNPSNQTGSSDKATIEPCKTKYYLDSSVQNLSFIFEIQQQSVETIMSSEKVAIHQVDGTEAIENDKQNAYEIVNGIPKLTEHGRGLILCGTLKREKMPNLIEGNPDTQPVRTFEFAILVKIALFLSFFINRRYDAFFVQHYGEMSFLGNVLQQLLSPPIKYVRYSKSPDRLTTEMAIETLPPRVNLRFIASKAFVFYILTIFILCGLFNFSCLSLTLLLWIVFLSYLCTKSALTSIKSR